jgi:Glycosyl transferase family 2
MQDDSDAMLVLNPDLRLAPDAVIRLWRRLQHEGVGATVPLMTDRDKAPYRSLRFEPSLTRHLGDAALGAHLRTRPEWATETDWHPESYRHAHPIEWATGACVLVDAEAVRSVGAWDEQYFLYSEEVDFMRRVRQAGWTVWFEPTSVVEHAGGGSGSSPELAALMTVNKVRYGRSHHGRLYARAVRAIALAAAVVRVHDAGSRTAARYLISERRWEALPAATRPTAGAGPRPHGAVVIPAHNEASVLGRTLRSISDATAAGSLEVIVAANACTDETVSVASAFPGVTVVDLVQPSKVGALNAADGIATLWPRLYLDADIEITPRAIAAVFDVLSGGSVLAARPTATYDTSGASRSVRAFYRARQRMPVTGEHLWGGGAYALSAAGHARLHEFPDLTADDLFVDSLFGDHEKAVVPTDPVIVRTPRTVRSLLTVLARTYRGNAEIVVVAPPGGQPTVRSGRSALQLLRTATTPARLIDALVYGCLVVAARLLYRRSSLRWERDESSREKVVR